MQVRGIQQHGQFYWHHHDVFLSKVLYGERICLLAIDDHYYRVYLLDYTNCPTGHTQAAHRTIIKLDLQLDK